MAEKVAEKVAENLHETFLNMSQVICKITFCKNPQSSPGQRKTTERESQCYNTSWLLCVYSSATQSFMSCIIHTCIFIYWQMLFISLVCSISKTLGYYSQCTKLEKAKKIQKTRWFLETITPPKKQGWNSKWSNLEFYFCLMLSSKLTSNIPEGTVFLMTDGNLSLLIGRVSLPEI